MDLRSNCNARCDYICKIQCGYDVSCKDVCNSGLVAFGIMILNRVMDVHSADVDSFVLRMEEVVVVVKKTLPLKRELNLKLNVSSRRPTDLDFYHYRFCSTIDTSNQLFCS